VTDLTRFELPAGERGSRYQAPFIRSRGCRMPQRLGSQSPRKHIGLLPPLSSFPRTVGFSDPERAAGVHPVATSLAHLRPTAACCPTACRFPTCVLRRRNPRSESASRKLLAPSAYPDPGALLLAPFEAYGRLPAFQKPRPQGLATLSAASAPKPLEAFFSPQRSWGFPFRAFLFSRGSIPVSRNRSPHALAMKTSRPPRGASGVSTHRKSRVPNRSPED
jgi:hypothetical protein